jgi:hypothetical protein
MTGNAKSVTFTGDTPLSCYLQYEKFVDSINARNKIDNHTTEITEVIKLESIWSVLKHVVSTTVPHPHDIHKLIIIYKVNTSFCTINTY